MANALAAETSPYLRQHQDNPVDWLPWGDDRARPRPRRGQAAARLHRLLGVPLVPRHGARVLRGPRGRPPDERALRLREGRPRGAARRRRHLHGGGAGDDRATAAGRSTSSARPTRCRSSPGTYFPPDAAPGHAGLAAGARGDRRRVARRGATRSASRATRSPSAWAAPRCSSPRASRLPGRRPRRGRREPARPVRLDPGRLRRRAEVPAVLGAALPARRTASARCRCRRCGRWRAAASTTRSAAASPATPSTRTWTVPHFEKMLYDNALLARAYLHGWLVSGDETLRRMCEETLEFVLRELRGPEGGFVLRPRRRLRGRGGQVLRLVATTTSSTRSTRTTRRRRVVWFGATAQGNFEGTNVLESRGPGAARPSSARGSGSGSWRCATQRVRPGLDDKRLTGVERARARRPRRGRRPAGPRGPPRRRARATPSSCSARCATSDGRLLRTSDGTTAKLNAYLEDHAFLVEALLDLYEATFEPRWFAAAREIADAMIDRFADHERGGFFSTSDDHEQLVTRRKDLEDNPIPSGSSSAALGLLRLAALTGEDALRAPRAAPCCGSLHPFAARHPQAFGHLLLAIAFALHPPREVALAGRGPRRRSSACCASGSGRRSCWPPATARTPAACRCSRAARRSTAVRPPTCASASPAGGRSRTPASSRRCSPPASPPSRWRSRSPRASRAPRAPAATRSVACPFASVVARRPPPVTRDAGDRVAGVGDGHLRARDARSSGPGARARRTSRHGRSRRW